MPKRHFLFLIYLLCSYHAVGQNNDVFKIQNQKLNDSAFFFQAQKVNLSDVFIKQKDSLTCCFLARFSNLKYSFHNDLGFAIELTEKVIAITKQLDKQPNLSKYYYNLSYFLVKSGDYEGAIPFLKTGFDIETNNEKKMYFLFGLVDAYLKIGDFQQAIVVSKLGLSISKKQNKTGFEFLNSLIHTYNSLKRYDLALSVKIPNHVTPQEYHRFNLNRAISLQGLKRYEEARSIYTELGLFYKKNDDYFKLVTYSLNNIIFSYIEENKLDDALKYLRKADTVCDKNLTSLKHENIARLYENEGYIYFKKKKYYHALSIYQKALLKLPFNYSQENSLSCPNLKTVNSVGNKPYVLSILEAKAMTLSELFLATKKDKYAKSAIKYYFLADSLIDFMRKEHTQEISKFFWREQTHTFYENAIEICHRLKDNEKAFYFMEKSRAILLLDALRNLDAKKLLNPQQQNEEQNLRYAILGLQNKLASLKEEDKTYAQIFQKLFDAKEKYHKFIQTLEKSNPIYYSLKYGSPYIHLADWQKYLSQNKQSAIQYFVGDSAVYALATSNKKTILKKINIANYQHLARNFVRLAAQKPYSDAAHATNLSQISYQLYKLIFEPFKLPKGRVIISPDGYFIPFNALVSDNKTNQYTLQDYAFSYAYSANLLLKKEDTKWQFKNNLLAVSPVNFKKKLDVLPLTSSDISAENIKDKYFSGKCLANEEASKANFIKNAGNYKFIQLFTHGNADSTEDGSKIYFQDDILTLKELYSLEKLHADLVVLSACQTNLGRIATGEGIMSVARGFAYLDVPSTISTLWSVETLATYKITEAFYKYLHEGFEKDIALQMAQKEYLQNTDETMPYYWSAMVLVGKADKTPINLLFYVALFLFLICSFIVVKVIKLRSL